MTDYGKSAVLGTATILPATSAAGIFLADRLNPWIIDAFLILNVVWLVVLIAHISRYVINRNTQ